MPNKCARCETEFKNWQEYYAHHLNIRCAVKLYPVNTSGRDKKTIVAAFEAKNERSIIA